MALEVAEGAAVGDDLEAVAQRLEPAARAMSPVRALADHLAEQRLALGSRQRADADASLLLAHAGRLEEQRGEQRLLVAVDVQQPHRGPGAVVQRRGAVEPEPRRPAGRGLVAPAQIG